MIIYNKRYYSRFSINTTLLLVTSNRKLDSEDSTLKSDYRIE